MKRWVTTEAINNMFAYHPPAHEGVAATHTDLRAACERLAHQINAMAPECPEKTTAITKVREAMFWANAAVACHMNPPG